MNAPNQGYSAPPVASATKIDVPTFDLPIAVQTVPQQVIQDQNAVRIEDALENVSGVRSTTRACVQLGGDGTRTDQNQTWNAVVRLTRVCGRDSQISNCVIHGWSA